MLAVQLRTCHSLTTPNVLAFLINSKYVVKPFIAAIKIFWLFYPTTRVGHVILVKGKEHRFPFADSLPEFGAAGGEEENPLSVAGSLKKVSLPRVDAAPGAAAWVQPHSSPYSPAPCEHLTLPGLAHFHCVCAPPTPFYPTCLCVYQTDSTISANPKSRSQSAFMDMDWEPVYTNGQWPDHI